MFFLSNSVYFHAKMAEVTFSSVIYYEWNGAALAPILRDADVHPVTRELVELRMAPLFVRMHEVLAEPFRARGPRRRRLRAMLGLFLDFNTWRIGARAISRKEAVEAAVRALRCQ